MSWFGPWSTSHRRRFLRLALPAVLVVAAATLAACGDDDDGNGAGADPSTSSTTTSTTSTTTGQSGGVPAGAEAAVHPAASGTERFDDPVDAARSFAVDYIRFAAPVLGPFQAGDSRSGEVEVRPRANGPVTTVLLRQFGDSWWVLGSQTPNIVVEEPEGLAAVSSPLRVAGRSTAFEATVGLEIRQDGDDEPLADTFVMGGSMGEIGPFEDDIEFDDPTAARGALVLLTESAEDGSPWEATVLRIVFE